MHSTIIGNIRLAIPFVQSATLLADNSATETGPGGSGGDGGAGGAGGNVSFSAGRDMNVFFRTENSCG